MYTYMLKFPLTSFATASVFNLFFSFLINRHHIPFSQITKMLCLIIVFTLTVMSSYVVLFWSVYFSCIFCVLTLCFLCFSAQHFVNLFLKYAMLHNKGMLYSYYCYYEMLEIIIKLHCNTFMHKNVKLFCIFVLWKPWCLISHCSFCLFVLCLARTGFSPHPPVRKLLTCCFTRHLHTPGLHEKMQQSHFTWQPSAF